MLHKQFAALFLSNRKFCTILRNREKLLSSMYGVTDGRVSSCHYSEHDDKLETATIHDISRRAQWYLNSRLYSYQARFYIVSADIICINLLLAFMVNQIGQEKNIKMKPLNTLLLEKRDVNSIRQIVCWLVDCWFVLLS